MKKQGCTLRTNFWKFLDNVKEGRNGFLGYHYEAEQLRLRPVGAIVDRQLKALDFSTFKVADALEVIKADIMEEIRLANRCYSAADLIFYFSENFPKNFTQGVLLVAECLADHYRTGELVVYDYAGENYDPLEHRVKEFVVTEADLKLLLDKLQSVQNRSIGYTDPDSGMKPAKNGWLTSRASTKP